VNAALGLGVTAAVLGAAFLVPWPTVSAPLASTVVTPAPSGQQRVCAGPVLAPAENSADAEAANSVGSAAVVAAAREGVDQLAELPLEASALEAVDNLEAARDGGPQVLALTVPDGAVTAPLVAASQSQTAASETLAGFAAAACTEASNEAWLVGGSTALGRTSLVLLSNPSTVLATVDLIVYGETGPIDAPGSTGILVQPGTQRVISLAGLAPNLNSPVLHMRAQGGQVAVSLQQSVVEGITPGGVDLVSPAAAPSLRPVIAGVVVATAPTDAGPDSDAALENNPSVRILVPGTQPATVQVGVTGEDGAATGTSIQAVLPAGIVTEVPLIGLEPGSYTVRLTADQPVVTAAHVTTSGIAGSDFAWFTSSPPIRSDFLVSVAPGPSPALHLVNTATESADFTVASASGGGTPSMVSLPAGESAVVPLAAGAQYVVSSSAGSSASSSASSSAVVASVSYSGDGLLASFALEPASRLAEPITVYTH
jgi:hypothetical protein